MGNLKSILCVVLLIARTSDFSRCDYRAAQIKHAVVYGSARTGDFNRGD
jgi:hypothetical protein